MNTLITIDAELVSRPIDTTALTFADNPQPRCPVILLLDCSLSMSGAPIKELEAGVRQFYQELAADPIAAMSVEVSIITFGQTVQQIKNFETIAETSQNIPHLQANGNTPMGAALTLALSEIQHRRQFYKRNGLAAYKPWIVLLTDGQPNDDYQTPAQQARIMSAKGRLTFLGVGIGDQIDMQTLKAIVPGDPGALKLRGLAFKNFFRWLSDSLRVVTTGSTIQNNPIPSTDEYDWNF